MKTQQSILQAALEVLLNKEVQKQVLKFVESPIVQKVSQEAFRTIIDFFQVSTGQVNRQSCEVAITTATKSCLRQDQESLARVAAFVSALYTQHEIYRGAQVGGSLLKRFGSSWFPRIKEREKRYALSVSKELEDYLYEQILLKTKQQE